MLAEIIVLLILLACCAFFAGVETATMSLSKAKVRSLVEQKKPGAKALQQIKQNPHRLLVTLLMGNNLVTILTASFSTEVASRIFGSTGVGIATGVITVLILVFGEITPKSFAIAKAEKLSLFAARPIQIIQFLLTPALWVFEGITKLINKLFGQKNSDITEEELRALITIGREEGLLDKDATQRLHSVLDFERATVKDIMTTRASVVTFDANLTVEQFLDNVLDSPFDHHPLYEGREDKIVGVLDLIDVVRAVKEEKQATKLKEIMRPIFFVKETARLDTLMREFKQTGTSLGIVLGHDEKMVGVFTAQDIVEEIVGDIFEDEVFRNGAN